MKTLIIGNGVNVNFDNINDWSQFASDCYANFLVKIHELRSRKDNINAFSVVSTWDSIKEAIDFNDPALNNIEVFTVSFDLENYLENDKHDIVYCELLGTSLLKYDFPSPYTMDKSGRNLLLANENLNYLNEIFQKAVMTTLMEEYKINDIQYSKEFIEYANKNYDQIISLNYDSNDSCMNNVIKLHGSFKTQFAEIDKRDQRLLLESVPPKFKKQAKWWSDWYMENAIFNTHIVLNYDSLKKMAYQINGEKMSLSGFKTLENSKTKMDIKNTYDSLICLEGDVDVIGVSIDCDEIIPVTLEQRKEIGKVTWYSEKSHKNFKKIKHKHFSKFWEMTKDN